MFANIALPLFIVFTGIFCGILMNEYKDMTKAGVLFIDTHWMTSATNMEYFKYLSNFYQGKTFRLVYDNAPGHYIKTVDHYMKYWNETPNNICSSVNEFVDTCLTSVYQPPNVMYNKPF